MCYSAMIQANYKKYQQLFGAAMSLREFYDVFFRRAACEKLKVPKAMEAALDSPQTPDEQAVKELIDRHNVQQATAFEQELFKQRKRLVDAERSLQTRTTKKAEDDRRIAPTRLGSCWSACRTSNGPSSSNATAACFRVTPCP